LFGVRQYLSHHRLPEIHGGAAFLSENENGGNIVGAPIHFGLLVAWRVDVGMAFLARAIPAQDIWKNFEGDSYQAAG
jgi:hypothetical protein